MQCVPSCAVLSSRARPLAPFSLSESLPRVGSVSLSRVRALPSGRARGPVSHGKWQPRLRLSSLQLLATLRPLAAR